MSLDACKELGLVHEQFPNQLVGPARGDGVAAVVGTPERGTAAAAAATALSSTATAAPATATATPAPRGSAVTGASPAADGAGQTQHNATLPISADGLSNPLAHSRDLEDHTATTQYAQRPRIRIPITEENI